MLKQDAPIGVFDSGVGGLSVLLEIKKLLPYENLIYVADSGNVPYGNKSPEFIRQRSESISDFLISQGAKAIVIACNTATASSILRLRKKWPEIIFVGMEPAVKPALALTKKGVVGVLATVGTLKSAQFAALLDKFAARTKVVMQPAPGLVECVEKADLTSHETQILVKSFVDPLLKKGADVIVLGCTHYPFLREAISKAAGKEVALVDTGAAVARQLQTKLKEFKLEAQESLALQNVEFFSSGDLQEAKRVVSFLTEIAVEVKSFPIH
jgi:glutamate racemase